MSSLPSIKNECVCVGGGGTFLPQMKLQSSLEQISPTAAIPGTGQKQKSQLYFKGEKKKIRHCRAGKPSHTHPVEFGSDFPGVTLYILHSGSNLLGKSPWKHTLLVGKKKLDPAGLGWGVGVGNWS